MNFAITWLFDKLGYMPKIDMQVGKVNLDIKPPEFQMWPFREDEDKPKPRVRKTRALPSKATVAKATIRNSRAKKVS
jgi:hypothetical protein